MNDTARRVFRLLWSPCGLVETAMAIPTLAAVCIGFVTATLIAAALLSVLFAGMGEPYPSAAAYLADAFRGMVPSLFGGAILSGAVWLIFGTFALRWSSNRRYRSDLLGLHALALAGLPVLYPVLVWAPLAIIAAPAARSSLGVSGTLPAYMTWPLAGILGSPWWGWLFVVIPAILWVHTLARITTIIAAEHDCPSCGYDLRGLPTDTCPECGRAPAAADLRS